MWINWQCVHPTFAFTTGTTSPDHLLPTSSYRLGVRSAPLHDIYNPHMTVALREALLKFDRRMPGFVCDSALLHGVETRTSAPVQVRRYLHLCPVSI